MDADHGVDEPPELADALSDSGSDSELDEGEWVTGEAAIDWSTDPDAMSWAAASASVDDQLRQQRAASFESCAPCSEAAGGFHAARASTTPARLSAALAGGALGGAYASGGDGAARRAGAAASDAEITAAQSTARPVVETSIPTDLRWPSADELELTAAVSELAAAGGAASHVEVDARMPTFRVEMQHACNCDGTDVDCLLELWNKPDSEAWVSYHKCEAAAARVRDIVKNKPRFHYTLCACASLFKPNAQH